MIKQLITDATILAERSNEFDIRRDATFNQSLIQDLGDTLNSLDDRLFLTAKEIGYPVRAFAAKLKDEINIFLNPAYKSKDKLIFFREKDFITGKEFFMPRYSEISLVFQDALGNIKGFKFNEGASIIISQAMSLLDGILDEDIGLEVLPEFLEASEEERLELLSAYAQSIAEYSAILDNELNTDLETKEEWNAAKFISAFAEGKIETEAKELSNRKKKQLNKFLKLFKQKGIKVKHD